MLFFENLSGVKEDEYFRDGITEDIITELSKIKGLNIFSRPTVLAFRDKPVTPAQIGQQLGAAYVLGGSLRRAGNRLRINAQLIDTHTDFPLWSERYDREMEDVFEVQDEIARKIAEALRITLSPQEQAALAAKPTENLQAYDLYLRGKSYARRLTQQDLEFALQMFESAVALDPKFALAYAAIANVCAQYYYRYGSDSELDRSRAGGGREGGRRCSRELPEAQVARGWVLYADNQNEDAVDRSAQAIERKPDCEGAYYLLGRALFSARPLSGDRRRRRSGDRSRRQRLQRLRADPERARRARQDRGRAQPARAPHRRRSRSICAKCPRTPARACSWPSVRRDRPVEDAMREANLAHGAASRTRPTVLYNAACAFCMMDKKAEAMDAIQKAWEAGFKDAVLGAPRSRPGAAARRPGVRAAVQ